MTVLVLAHKRILSLRSPIDMARIEAWFSDINGRGVISFTLGIAAVIGVLVYIGAVYASFNFTYGIRAETQAIKILENVVVGQEYRVHTAEANLAQDNKTVLESMEKISDIIYLTPDRFAANYSIPYP